MHSVTECERLVGVVPGVLGSGDAGGPGSAHVPDLVETVHVGTGGTSMYTCSRCGALMIRERTLRHAGEQQLIVWETIPEDEPVDHCICCGNLEDETIRANRLGNRTKELPTTNSG